MGEDLVNQHKKWTKEEDEILLSKFGSFSYKAIAKELGRTPKAIYERKKKVNITVAKDNDDYITRHYLSECLNICHKTVRRWEKNFGLKINKKNITYNRIISRIRISEFWKWAKENHELINWERFEIGKLGIEPEWVKEVRKNYNKPKKFYRKWTTKEIALLKSYYKLGKSVKEIAEILKRTPASVKARATIENVLRTDLQIWTFSERERLKSLFNQGYTSKQIAGIMDKTHKSVQNAKQRFIINPAKKEKEAN